MTITAKSGFGTLLKIGDGATSEAFTTIEGVRNLTGPEYGLETFDATHHSSSGSYREMVASFLDAGEINFDLLYDSTNSEHAQLFTDYEAKTLRNFELLFADAGTETHSFSAFISGMSMSAPIDDALTMSCTLRISGQVTRS